MCAAALRIALSVFLLVNGLSKIFQGAVWPVEALGGESVARGVVAVLEVVFAVLLWLEVRRQAAALLVWGLVGAAAVSCTALLLRGGDATCRCLGATESKLASVVFIQGALLLLALLVLGADVPSRAEGSDALS